MMSQVWWSGSVVGGDGTMLGVDVD
jgi:hypothetical protein